MVFISKKKHLCESCGETDPDNFYGKRKIECKCCFNKRCGQILRDKRKRLLDERDGGAKCENCGYDRYQGALEFHHPDPSDKDPNWAVTKNWTYDRMKKKQINVCCCVLIVIEKNITTCANNKIMLDSLRKTGLATGNKNTWLCPEDG